MRKIALSMAVAAAVVVTSLPMMPQDAYAKGFSSSRSFSSSSFSRSTFRAPSAPSKPSGGFWGSSKPKAPTTTGKLTSGAGSKPAPSLKTGGGQKASIAGSQSARTKQVLAAKRQEAKFRKPATVPGLTTSGGKRPSRIAANKAYRDTYKTNPVYKRASSYDSSTYYARRDRYYGSYHPPAYVYNTSPSFGMWDTVFLYYMLNNSHNSGQFAYNHQNDADYLAWRREADALARDNADLRKQLAAMDAQSAQYAGTPVDPGYLPKGVDADIALASGARQSTLPTVNVCTGGRNGAYFLTVAGVMAPNVDGVNIVPVETAGSGDNLKAIEEGKCDMAFVQGDSYWNYVEDHQTANLPFKRVFSPYRESVHLFCNVNGPSEISDLTAKNKVWFPAGSGAAQTWRNFIGEDKDYAKVQTVLTNPNMQVSSNEEALMKVSEDKNSCMMYVAAAGATDFLKQANAGAKSSNIVLIDIDDGALDNTEDPSGRDVYSSTQFDQELYSNLTRKAGVVYGGGDVDTLTVAADFIVSTKWADANKALYPKVRMQMTGLTDRIQAVVKPHNQ